MIRPPTLALLGILFLIIAPTAMAFNVTDGVVLQYVGTPTTLTFATGGTSSPACIEFEANGAPRLDGVTLDIHDGTWSITQYAPGSFTITANLASPTTFSLRGPQKTYAVTGIGYGTVNIAGSSTATYNLAAGSHTVNVVGSGGSPAVDCHSGYYVQNGLADSINAVDGALESGTPLVLTMILAAVALGLIGAVLLVMRRG